MLLFVLASTGCGSPSPSPEGAPSGAPSPTREPDDELPPSELETNLPPAVRDALFKDSTDDFDKMIERNFIRVGVTPTRTFYFVDRGVQRGIAYDYGVLMEERLNQKLKSRNVRVHVVLVPLPRAKMLSALIGGKIDMAAGFITITPERQAIVDFSDPTRTKVQDIIVTGPGSKPLATADALSGKTVYVREDSAYEASLKTLNETLQAAARPPVIIKIAPDNLEDDDLLEMVNAGLIPAVVTHDYLARFWKKVFPGLVLHENIPVRGDSDLGIAIRKNNPQLRAALNTFMGKFGLQSAFGQNVERKYLVNTTYVKNAASEAERRKFLAIVDLFKKYGSRYDMDYLLMAAQGYQESRLDQDARSPVGAVGVMQLMPPTGKEMNVGDIYKTENNIHAGVKYMRTVLNTTFIEDTIDPLNKTLLTFASYNAGPGRVRALRREAQKRGLDPNVWFGNVEQIASERIGRETVTYVGNIYKYYIAYRLVEDDALRDAAAKASMKGAGS